MKDFMLDVKKKNRSLGTEFQNNFDEVIIDYDT